MKLPILSLLALTTAASANWPQWRGPAFDGTAPDAKPPTTWSETQNVKWKLKIPGLGTSTPIVWGDTVYIVTAVTKAKAADAPPAVPAAQVAPPPAGEGGPGGPRRRGGGGGGRSEKPSDTVQFTVLAVDRATGKIRWEKIAREEVPHEGHHRDHGFASSSPVTDGQHLIAFFGSRGLYCYDMKGTLVWEKDLGDMQTRNSFGEGASPALHGNTVVVNWDHEGADFVVAFDKSTGKELWRQPRDEDTTWVTPLIVEHGGKAQVIVSATKKIRSYDLTSGAQIWECGGMTSNVIPTPIVRDGVAYILSGFRGAAALAIQLGRTGDLTGTDAILWQHNKGTPYVPSPLLAGGRLYFFAGNNGTLTILDAKSGKPLVEQARIDGLLGGVYASPVAAGGHIYLVGRDGKTVVLKAGDTVEPLATNTLEDRFDASAAIVGSQLFLRGHQHLYCIAE